MTLTRDAFTLVMAWATTALGGAAAAPDERPQRRVIVTVEVGETARHDRPVEAAVTPEVYQVLAAANGAVRIHEIDAAGRLLDPAVPAQLDREGEGGTLVLLLEGTTAKGATRRYRVSRGETATPKPLVTLVDGVDHEGQASLKIVTPAATYYYHKAGAGFASLEDRDGRDWLGYRPQGGSDGKYRGIPNLVHPEGYFHPGGAKCTTRVLARGPLKATFESLSKDGKWAVRWDVFPTFARLTVLKVAHPYWFLYEGTPGGRIDMDTDYCIRAPGTRTKASQRWDGDLPDPEWVCFGDARLKRLLYLVHHEADKHVDSYWPMQRNMTVFGFGRQGLRKFMTRVPAQFTIGLADEGESPSPLDLMRSAYLPLRVRVEHSTAQGKR